MFVSSWTSLTGVFFSKDMEKMRATPALTLVPWLLESDPLVALQVLTELLLHKDYNRLLVLMTDDRLNRHWRLWDNDPKIRHLDALYAKALNKFSNDTWRLQ